jgi:hypothetical protein
MIGVDRAASCFSPSSIRFDDDLVSFDAKAMGVLV